MPGKAGSSGGGTGGGARVGGGSVGVASRGSVSSAKAFGGGGHERLGSSGSSKEFAAFSASAQAKSFNAKGAERYGSVRTEMSNQASGPRLNKSVILGGDSAKLTFGEAKRTVAMSSLRESGELNQIARPEASKNVMSPDLAALVKQPNATGDQIQQPTFDATPARANIVEKGIVHLGEHAKAEAPVVAVQKESPLVPKQNTQTITEQRTPVLNKEIQPLAKPKEEPLVQPLTQPRVEPLAQKQPEVMQNVGTTELQRLPEPVIEATITSSEISAKPALLEVVRKNLQKLTHLQPEAQKVEQTKVHVVKKEDTHDANAYMKRIAAMQQAKIVPSLEPVQIGESPSVAEPILAPVETKHTVRLSLVDAALLAEEEEEKERKKAAQKKAENGGFIWEWLKLAKNTTTKTATQEKLTVKQDSVIITETVVAPAVKTEVRVSVDNKTELQSKSAQSVAQEAKVVVENNAIEPKEVEFTIDQRAQKNRETIARQAIWSVFMRARGKEMSGAEIAQEFVKPSVATTSGILLEKGIAESVETEKEFDPTDIAWRDEFAKNDAMTKEQAQQIVVYTMSNHKPVLKGNSGPKASEKQVMEVLGVDPTTKNNQSTAQQ